MYLMKYHFDPVNSTWCLPLEQTIKSDSYSIFNLTNLTNY